jgi:hypothetical protein
MTIEYAKNTDGLFVCQHKGCSVTKKNQNTMYYHMKRHMEKFDYTCKDCDKGFLQKSAYLHHLAAIHPETKTVCLTTTAPKNGDKDNKILEVKIDNPYCEQIFKCPCCDHSTRTKSNALVHYARLHAKDWIPAFDKAKGCPKCQKTFESNAAYLYHCTACVPASKSHCAMITRITQNVAGLIISKPDACKAENTLVNPKVNDIDIVSDVRISKSECVVTPKHSICSVIPVRRSSRNISS